MYDMDVRLKSRKRGLAVATVILVFALVPGTGGQSKVDFTRDIQPIIQRSCLGCHSAANTMGGLRLDSKAVAAKVIVTGNAAASSLYRRVTATDDKVRMPMGGKPLEAAQITLIREWLDQGATWPEGAGEAAGSGAVKHWAFVPPRKPALPVVTVAGWTRNPIDHFILARLEKEGLSPSPEADRVTLLRRLSLDLSGLPPTPGEVDAFLADRSADAYEKQVARLLESPHYGERWARHWLDAARYADSDGFEKDKQRWVWSYRDWVINAHNHDLPYDRFILEQIAGDLLPDATQDQRVATGFLRNSMINEEGGIDPEQFRMEAMFDRMDAIGKGILGITIQCTQCHNHKYDPITQEEYYRLFAFLNNAHESNITVYSPEDQQKRASIFRQIREIEGDLQHKAADWRERMAAWEAQVKSDQPEWIIVRPEVEDISNGGQKYLPMPDDSFLAQGYAPTKHRVKMTVKTDVPKITAFRLELLTDPNLPLGGPGRSIKGTGALTEFEVEARLAGSEDKPVPVKIDSASADFNGPEEPLNAIYSDKTDRRRVTGPVEFAIDGKDETAWGTDAGPGRRNQPRKAVFRAEKPVTYAGAAELTFYLSQRHGGWNSDDNQNHNLGRMRLAITSAPDAVADPLPQAVRDIMSIPVEKRTVGQVNAVFSYWRTTVPEWKEANDRIEMLWRGHPEGSSQLILSERSDVRPTHMLARGDFLKPGKQVEPGTPAFLHPFPKDAPRTRLGFAQWLGDRGSPTTARTLVNRVWQNYFGTGIVATSEDLGRQSEAASHPELLDWLAVEFMEKGWSMKKLHRLIVTSATYRQSSKVTPALQSKDPFNRLLARAPRQRVEAEIVRDIALAASGLLNRKVGGPPVFPPAPEFLFQPPASYGPKNWPEETGDDRYRRGIYTFRFRSVPYPMLQAYDAPNGDFACTRRPRSNTPLQALTSLNEPLFLETAQALAFKTVREGGATDSQRLTFAFRRCVSREPTEAEGSTLLAFLKEQQQRIAEGWVNPWQLAGFEPTKATALPNGATPTQLAAWTAVSRVLLNLDETITKE
jgi:hypothetical protein